MKITSRFSGFSQHLILLSDTGDEHKPKICQSAHLKGWDDTVEGALQRNSQVTGQSEAPRRPFTHFTATFRRLNLLRLTGRKMFVRQRKTRCVWVFGASLSATHCCFTKAGFCGRWRFPKASGLVMLSWPKSYPSPAAASGRQRVGKSREHVTSLLKKYIYFGVPARLELWQLPTS